ncbi:MAG: PAS domain-containing protein, partial [Gammaproteobacteria bacterium]|nr:PAS domain-containing protein [Gammaproteobacteria bacterium]
MKNNQPVTQVETPIPEGETLVSKTDLKGTILSANDIFIKISGFSQAELYNKNHNVVRHPDIPPRVFEDLWETLKAGRPWSQVVKNRCKDGSHYWVQANACPILENDKVVGYTSYRTPINDEQTKQAVEAAYRGIAEGRLKIEGGKIYTSTQFALRKLRLCSHLPLWIKSALGVLFFFLLAFCGGKWLLDWSFPWSAMGTIAIITAAGTGGVVRHLIAPLRDISATMRQISQQRYDTPVTFVETPEIRTLQEQLKMMQIL